MIRDMFRSLCSKSNTRAAAMVLMAAAIACPSVSVAVEGGGSNWAMGSTGFSAGRIPEPGFHYANLLWHMPVTTSQDFTFGGNRVFNMDIDITVNTERTHQGKMCCGLTPMATLEDGKRIWKEKLIA